MIGWLQGQRLDNWQQALKKGVLLACSGIGYEVQLLPRFHALIRFEDELTLWIHQIKREDGESLYGFQTKTERDLFRKLIGVSGVGPQIGIALLEEVQVDELVLSIIQEDIHTLSRAQGVGKRTAERLSIELRHKLSEFDQTNHEIAPGTDEKLHEPPFTRLNINELQATLSSLGYEDYEINRAIQEVSKEFEPGIKSKNPDLTVPAEDIECLLKACLLWLSNDSKS